MKVDIVVTNVVQSGGSGDNVELGGRGTSSNPNLVNDEKCVSSRTKFDDDSQDMDEDDGGDISGCDLIETLDVWSHYHIGLMFFFALCSSQLIRN